MLVYVRVVLICTASTSLHITSGICTPSSLQFKRFFSTKGAAGIRDYERNRRMLVVLFDVPKLPKKGPFYKELSAR